MEKYHDIVCQVLANNCREETIFHTLDAFLIWRESLDVDYAESPDGTVFDNEYAMVQYFVSHSERQTFYWNGINDENERLMIGANITSDGNLIMSVTFDGTDQQADAALERLKTALASEIGIISSPFPAEYENGLDFKRKYSGAYK